MDISGLPGRRTGCGRNRDAVGINPSFEKRERTPAKEITPESLIPIEKIGGPVLLISTQADTVWPSAEQVSYIESYLQENGFPYEVKHLQYEHVSHFAIPMRSNVWLLKLLFQSERSQPEECNEERNDISEQAVEFIQNHW